MLPSSPVSVGICPSYRTLEVGSVQVMVPLMLVTLEQCPVAEEPFTDTPAVAEKLKLDGKTVEMNNLTELNYESTLFYLVNQQSKEEESAE